MKLKFLAMAVAVAAMGPAREAPPPAVGAAAPPETQQPMSPEEMAGATVARRSDPVLAEHDARTAAPADFLWLSRPIVVFADTPDDPAFREQMRMLRDRPAMLLERDVVVIADSDPGADSPWRRQFHPRGFSLVILDKDGQVKLRKPLPWDVREISRAIDKFPLRRQEIGRAGVLP